MTGKEEVLKALKQRRQASESSSTRKQKSTLSPAKKVSLYAKGQLSDGMWAINRAAKVVKGFIRAAESEALPMDEDTISEIAGPYVQQFEDLYLAIANSVVLKVNAKADVNELAFSGDKVLGLEPEEDDLRSKLEAELADLHGKKDKASKARAKAIQEELLSI